MARRAPRRARAAVRAAGNTRRAHRPDATREGDPLRRRLDALRVARTRRRPRRLAHAAHRARRRARGTRPRRPRAVLADRGARADADRLRAARARRRDGAAPALRRRDVVPGLLGTGYRAATSPRCACRAVPDGGDPATAPTWIDQRAEGLDEPGAVLRSLRAAHAHRARPTPATAASPRSSSTWTRPASPSRRSR